MSKHQTWHEHLFSITACLECLNSGHVKPVCDLGKRLFYGQRVTTNHDGELILTLNDDVIPDDQLITCQDGDSACVNLAEHIIDVDGVQTPFCGECKEARDAARQERIDAAENSEQDERMNYAYAEV